MAECDGNASGIMKGRKGIKRKAESKTSTTARSKGKRVKKENVKNESESEDEMDHPSSLFLDETESCDVKFKWEFEEVVACELNCPNWAVKNVISLLDQDNTVPFIARYRKEMTNNMEAKTLIDIKETYENLKLVRTKALTAIKAIQKLKKMTNVLITALLNAQTLTDVEHLYAPYKSGKKKTLAERARQLGLEPLALSVLNAENYNMNQYVKPETEGVSNLTEIETGIQNILADIISKDQELLQKIRNCLQSARVMLESCKSRAADKEFAAAKAGSSHGHRSKGNASQKFELYYTFSQPVKFVKPHQMLAINRGESMKILSVKIIIPENVKMAFLKFCENKWRIHQQFDNNNYRAGLLGRSCSDAWSRLVEPLLCRLMKSDLTKNAEKASVDVFATNLRQLLLTPPIRGNVVTGIDPGFRNGCKLAVISPVGNILHTDVFYLPQNGVKMKQECYSKISDTIHTYHCTIIGIGNGTATRETESLISELITNDAFKPLDVKYCIVNENGASIYSVTDDAKKEMPNLDPNLRSAVSIARRLQDPLAEYVKIEPKHLGVGMYQHDVSETRLKTALDDVVVECVSFVGVDVNTGSEALLKKVSGLSAVKARNIIEWRIENGPFCNREQLKLVKGLGPKSFEQCAGFIRVITHKGSVSEVNTKVVGKGVKKTKGKTKKVVAVSSEVNCLDMTCIHPESYETTQSFLNLFDESTNSIGSNALISKVKTYMECTSIEQTASRLKCGGPTLQLIVDGLSHPIDYDMRSEFQTPLFRKGVSCLSDLKPGTTLTGRVTNIVPFGAFVDVGVSESGLIHTSQMKGAKLQLGNRVEVSVLSVDIERGRLALSFCRLL